MAAPAETATPAKKKPNKIVLGIVLIIAIAGTGLLVKEILFRMSHVSTNNAQLEGEFYYITPKVGGMIKNVLVRNNDMVSAGQELITLDSIDYQITKSSAESNYTKAKNDYERLSKLFADGLVSKQELEHAKAAFDSAQAGYAKENQNITYTSLSAPVAGMVGKKNAEPGQVVAPGQSLMVVVPLEGLYITANIKETEIGRIKPGQSVDIKIDAFKGKVFKGQVVSIGAATGSKFSLLPPDNAAGNFVKVVQLIPVKIYFGKGETDNYSVRPGMSAEIAVNTR